MTDSVNLRKQAFINDFALNLTREDCDLFLQLSGCDAGVRQLIISGDWPKKNTGGLPGKVTLEWLEANKKIRFHPSVDLSYLALLCWQYSPGKHYVTLKAKARTRGFSLSFIPPTDRYGCY